MHSLNCIIHKLIHLSDKQLYSLCSRIYPNIAKLHQCQCLMGRQDPCPPRGGFCFSILSQALDKPGGLLLSVFQRQHRGLLAHRAASGCWVLPSAGGTGLWGGRSRLPGPRHEPYVWGQHFPLVQEETKQHEQHCSKAPSAQRQQDHGILPLCCSQQP